MITDIILAITNFVTHTINTLGYSGVVLLMSIESAAIPLPSEVIMPFSGFLVEAGRFTLLGLALAGAIGSTIGSLVTYYVGFYGGRPLVERYGKYALISHHDLELSERFFNHFRYSATFIGRLLPVIRTFISIPAGIAKAPIVPFTVNAFVGSFIWSYFLAWLGLKLGENWKHLEIYFRRFELLIGIAILSLLAYWIRRHLKHRG
ncbi:MAG: DedA family protein [Candidatus Doudnabacteria bacterium]|nr:DedA family protein [Candidatus Doudnabacteria bacterium]